MASRERIDRLDRESRAAIKHEVLDATAGADWNICEFVRDGLKIDLHWLQMLLLKLVFCALELLTDEDRAYLPRWAAGFALADRADGTGRLRYQGSYGVVPDVLERMASCRAAGRGWFREVVFVGGRRGSKSLLGAIAAAFVLWQLLHTNGPQERFGIVPPTKCMQVFVFAGTRQQGVRTQYADLKKVILNAPCFRPFIVEDTQGPLVLRSRPPAGRVPLEISIEARESTPLAGRGPASPVQLFDEVAHHDRPGATHSSFDVYGAAVPAMAQFFNFGLIWQASSPAQQIGVFFETYELGLTVDPVTHEPLAPDVLVLQLPSGALYEGWETAHEREMFPGGPHYARFSRPIISDDDPVIRNAYSRNRQWAQVEFGALWDTVQDRYLEDESIDLLFSSHAELALPAVHHCSPDCRHYVHVDTSKVQANTAIAVGHGRAIGDDTNVDIDDIQVMRPLDFVDGHIDYDNLEQRLKRILDDYHCVRLTFDGYESLALIQRLRVHVNSSGHRSRGCFIDDASASSERIWKVWESTKVALNGGLVHARFHELLQLELRFLSAHDRKVECPTSGPVKTKDVAIAFAHVVSAIREALPLPDFHLSPRGHPGARPNTPAGNSELSRFKLDRGARGHSQARGYQADLSRGYRKRR